MVNFIINNIFCRGFEKIVHGGNWNVLFFLNGVCGKWWRSRVRAWKKPAETVSAGIRANFGEIFGRSAIFDAWLPETLRPGQGKQLSYLVFSVSWARLWGSGFPLPPSSPSSGLLSECGSELCLRQLVYCECCAVHQSSRVPDRGTGRGSRHPRLCCDVRLQAVCGEIRCLSSLLPLLLLRVLRHTGRTPDILPPFIWWNRGRSFTATPRYSFFNLATLRQWTPVRKYLRIEATLTFKVFIAQFIKWWKTS